MQVRFRNGSKIIFKGMDKPAKLKSLNGVSIVWIEECSEVKYEGFKEILGRLRHPQMSNPVSYTHLKWNEDQIKLSEVLKVFDKKPLLGDQRGKTRWIVFIK